MRGSGADILYLDYDGVLHPDEVYKFPSFPHLRLRAPGHMLFENLSWLTQTLEQVPSVKIVLSTSWVRVFDYHRARRRLRLLGSRVIGATYHSRFMDPEIFKETPRHQQILADVYRRGPKRWLAVDDAVEAWPVNVRLNLFATESDIGLRDDAVRAEFLEKLRSHFA